MAAKKRLRSPLNLTIDDRVAKASKKLAAEGDRSLSNVIEELLLRWCQANSALPMDFKRLGEKE